MVLSGHCSLRLVPSLKNGLSNIVTRESVSCSKFLSSSSKIATGTFLKSFSDRSGLLCQSYQCRQLDPFTHFSNCKGTKVSYDFFGATPFFNCSCRNRTRGIAPWNGRFIYTSASSTIGLCQKARKEDQLTQHVAPEEGQLTIGHKVAQAGKDASYTVILLIGFGVTGVLVWYVISELLFSFSPNSVYSKALDLAKDDHQVKQIIGEPIKGYGEETSRGRRRHVSFQEYIVDDVNYMRVKFYVAGNKGKATVYADAKETSRGKFEFRYIFLETQGYPMETHVLLDNR